MTTRCLAHMCTWCPLSADQVLPGGIGRALGWVPPGEGAGGNHKGTKHDTKIALTGPNMTPKSVT